MGVQILVHLGGLVGAEREIIVGVAGGDGKVVVGLVLNYRVVPSVPDQQGREFDGVGTRGEIGVLGFDVGVVDGAVVSTVGFRGEIERFPGVLREGSHEALESGPEGGGTGSSAGFSVVDVGVREGPTGIGRGICRT